MKTDPLAQPRRRGINTFEKGAPSFRVGRQIKKLGCRGSDACALIFDDCRVPKESLVGQEGEGFKYVPNALEFGRINVMARAALKDSSRYAQQRVQFGQPICNAQAIPFRLAAMATQIEAARLLTWSAALRHHRGERCDLEAEVAKLFATEIGEQVTPVRYSNPRWAGPSRRLGG